MGPVRFKTALNLRIFAAFWREVFTRKDFMNYNWLVKALYYVIL